MRSIDKPTVFGGLDGVLKNAMNLRN